MEVKKAEITTFKEYGKSNIKIEWILKWKGIPDF